MDETTGVGAGLSVVADGGGPEGVDTSRSAETGISKPGRCWLFGGAMVVTAGIALALIVVRVGVRETAASRAYVDQPEYGVWGGLIFLLIVAGAVLGVVSAWWGWEIRVLPPNNDVPLWQIVFAWFGAAVAMAALQGTQLVVMPLDYPRVYPDALDLRIFGTGAISALVLAIPIVALGGLSRAAVAIDPSAGNAIERYSLLWSRQRDFLSALSAVLVLYILATAAKYQLNNNFTPVDDSPLPEVPVTYVLVVGAINGAIILLVYLPPYYATRRAGEALAKALCAVPVGEQGSPEAWLAMDEERQRYRAAMGLAEGTRQHLERNAVLLAPLITALITTLLPDVPT